MLQCDVNLLVNEFKSCPQLRLTKRMRNLMLWAYTGDFDAEKGRKASVEQQDRISLHNYSL